MKGPPRLAGIMATRRAHKLTSSHAHTFEGLRKGHRPAGTLVRRKAHRLTKAHVANDACGAPGLAGRPAALGWCVGGRSRNRGEGGD